jgi:uncharacterized membrane protein YhhN
MWVYPLLAALSLTALLHAERRGAFAHRAVFKTLTTLLFVLTAWAAGPVGSYGGYLFAGLLLSALGDLLLIPRAKPSFAAGLCAFLLAHLLYVLAFTTLAPLEGANWPLLVGLAALTSAFLYLFWERFGGLRLAVAVYAAVMTLMLASAWSVLLNAEVAATAGALIAAGATLFYLSDLFVALERFAARRFINKLLGLPLYYAAQFMLAFSLAAV